MEDETKTPGFTNLSDTFVTMEIVDGVEEELTPPNTPFLDPVHTENLPSDLVVGVTPLRKQWGNTPEIQDESVSASYAAVSGRDKETIDTNIVDLILDDSDDNGEEVTEIPKRICKFFNSKRGCIKGDKCVFLHQRQVCAFFNSDRGCSVQECPFVHDKSAVSSVQLKPCPNVDCPNVCIGKQCMTCHGKMQATQMQDRDDRRPSSRTHQQRQQRRSSDVCGYKDDSSRRSYRRSNSPPQGHFTRPDRHRNRYRSRAHPGTEHPDRDTRANGESRRPRRSGYYRSTPTSRPESGCRNNCKGRRCRECHLRNTALHNMENKDHSGDRQYHSDEGGFHDQKD